MYLRYRVSAQRRNLRTDPAKVDNPAKDNKAKSDNPSPKEADASQAEDPHQAQEITRRQAQVIARRLPDGSARRAMRLCLPEQRSVEGVGNGLFALAGARSVADDGDDLTGARERLETFGGAAPRPVIEPVAQFCR
jgi:hypothetical protein